MNTGLFLCRAECIGCESVDVDSLAERHGDLASLRVFDNINAAEAVEEMVSEVRDKSLDAVALGACSPHYFQNTPRHQNAVGFSMTSRIFGEKHVISARRRAAGES